MRKPPSVSRDYHAIDYKDGERGRNRTYNLLIKSQLLCQLSYAPATAVRWEQNLIISLRFALSCGVIERLRYFNFIYRGATFRATLGLGFPEERLYVMEQDCTFGTADSDHSLGSARRERNCPGSHPHKALHRSRNNETAARTLLGGRGRFEGGHTAASNDYTAGTPAG